MKSQQRGYTQRACLKRVLGASETDSHATIMLSWPSLLIFFFFLSDDHIDVFESGELFLLDCGGDRSVSRGVDLAPVSGSYEPASRKFVPRMKPRPPN